MNIIDFHTHAFPDAIAERAIPLLEEGGARACLDGKVASLLASMDASGIAQAVVCSIATKPEQYAPILKWSRAIASDRLIPFASIHPMDPDFLERIREVRAAGLLGLKLHPYYQGFDLDDERIFPFYEAVQESGLVLLGHGGYDISFPNLRRANPARFLHVSQAFPRLKLVAAHLGAWGDWDELRTHLLGRPIYLDTSFSTNFLPPAEVRELFLAHRREYLLFATDSPWAGQRQSVEELHALGLDEDLTQRILYRNAQALLAAVEAS